MTRLFMLVIGAILLLLLVFVALAHPQLEKPIAVCKDGVCTMSEADYKRFRDFHSAIIRAAMEREAAEEAIIEQLAKTRNQLMQCMHRRV